MDNANKNPIFSIKNFRSFGEDGADFELAPITVLTGCNSAGKSSLIKALILLSKQTTGKDGFLFDRIGSTFDYNNIYEKERIHPSDKLSTLLKELKLGKFDSVINEHTKEGTVSISYRLWSNYLQEWVSCRRDYCGKNGMLGEGRLNLFSVKKMDGTLIYKVYSGKELEPVEQWGYKQSEVDTLKEDDGHFDTIEENYNNFRLACDIVDANEKLIGLKRIQNKKNDAKVEIAIQKKEELVNKYNELIEQKKIALLPDSYTKEIILEWNRRAHDMIFHADRFKYDRWESLEGKELENEDKGLYYTLIINEVVAPWFINNISFIDSSTNEICRIYNVENKDKLSVLLYSLIKKNPNKTYKTGPFVNAWLERFEIGNSIEIEGTDEGLGVKVYLYKKEKKQLLADEGYGITQIVSLLLQIENKKNTKTRVVWDDEMGMEYGETKYLHSYIIVEEPEVHLHPKFQSLLADMFVEAYQKYKIHFIIETHSEYLIRKLQVMVADKNNTLTSNDVSLNYVEKDEHGVSHNKQIKIKEDGRLIGSFGKGFYDEADSLALELMKYKARKK